MWPLYLNDLELILLNFSRLWNIVLTIQCTSVTGWGMSELSPLALLNPLNGPRDGSCGLPVPNTTFKVIDVMTGKNLEANKEGEICCKGPQVT